MSTPKEITIRTCELEHIRYVVECLMGTVYFLEDYVGCNDARLNGVFKLMYDRLDGLFDRIGTVGENAGGVRIGAHRHPGSYVVEYPPF